MSAERIVLRGKLVGHNGWVTSIETTQEGNEMLLSGSRDKSLIQWNLTRESSGEENSYGYPHRRLTGHAHYVQDVVVSSDSQFALSASWDNTLRLWDLKESTCARRFVGHEGDVMAVAFSADNRQIVSGARDKKIKLWNTLGECKYTLEDKGHTEWVSCVKFSPNPSAPLVVSSGWDKVVKVWNLSNCKLTTNFVGHTGFINTVAVSPDGSLCASGGKDGTALLWDLLKNKHQESLPQESEIHSMVFSPDRYWLAVGTEKGLKIWDLESNTCIEELNHKVPDFWTNSQKQKFGEREPKSPACISLAWSSDGTILYSGHTDGVIRVWEIRN